MARAKGAAAREVTFARAAGRWALAGALATLGVVAACSSSGTTPAAEPGANGANGATLPCDVDAVLAANCRSCHGATPSFGAPMPLVTHADLVADAPRTAGKKVFEVVGARVHDDARPMPQPPNPRLGAADLATIDAWVAAGAPAGTSACDGGSVTPAGTGAKPLGCTPDQRIRPKTPYAVPTVGAGGSDDQYVCYGFDTVATTKRHVVAGAPRVDNLAVVHHILLYQAASPVDGTPQPCGAGGRSDWRLVTGWAPGGENFELPPEAGFAEEVGTTHWAVQIHYNNARNLEGQVDTTGYDLCSTDVLRPNDADILATGTIEISLPPRATTTTTCNLQVPQMFGTMHVTSAWAHMHKLGRAQFATRVRDGQETPILEAPAYDFATGAGAARVDVELRPGDTVRTSCTWENAGMSTVTVGEGTDDEMCFAFLTYWPKITDPRFRWALPSAPILSKCSSTSE